MWIVDCIAQNAFEQPTRPASLSALAVLGTQMGSTVRQMRDRDALAALRSGPPIPGAARDGEARWAPDVRDDDSLAACCRQLAQLAAVGLASSRNTLHAIERYQAATRYADAYVNMAELRELRLQISDDMTRVRPRAVPPRARLTVLRAALPLSSLQ
jgi:hypothetical protein